VHGELLQQHYMVARMTQDTSFDLEQIILKLLQQRGKDYLTVKQIVTGLPTAPRKRLALTTRQPTAPLLRKLTPYLGQHLQVYRGGRSTYIGRRLALEELIVRRIRQKPGVSSKQLGTQLPVAKKSYLTVLNTLLETGAVVCMLRENHTPCLRVAEPPVRSPATTPAVPSDERSAFKAVYDTVGQGRDFVRIHRLREALQWPHARFDRVLTDLRATYTVELHGGDPSHLSETDIGNSFRDEHGALYLTLSWRGRP
jgi:hypothetical protein